MKEARTSTKDILLSGLQPSGDIHIGNYLGAIKQWVELQNTHPSYFFLADLHALTVPQNPKELSKKILEAAAAYLALGINPDRTVFFRQSDIPEHTELMWLLGTITAMGDLDRMVSYKEKIADGKEALAGLFTYPVLMAADILLYKPAAVPVGEDQKQHVELTRELARRFNTRFGNTFPLPKSLVPQTGGRIMSLQDPSKKMSKSHGPQTYIALFDEPDAIRKKIKTAVTDSGKEVTYDPAEKPALANLVSIYHLFSEKSMKSIEQEFNGKGYGDFKSALAELLIEKLSPARARREELLDNKPEILRILAEGKEKAQKTAGTTLKECYEKAGLSLS